MDNILTQWIPWSDVSVRTGGLAVLRGSNSLPGFRRMRETYMDVDVSATDIEDAGAFTDDPHELHNLASQASPALKAELHQMVLEQFGCQGTKCT